MVTGQAGWNRHHSMSHTSSLGFWLTRTCRCGQMRHARGNCALQQERWSKARVLALTGGSRGDAVQLRLKGEHSPPILSNGAFRA